MASSRATTSAVSLEDWNSLAPLSDKSRASVGFITEAASEKPLPPKLARSVVTGLPTTRPATPSNSLAAGGSSVNLLRRAASRADVTSSNGSAPGTPGAPRSPAGGYSVSNRNTYFNSTSTGLPSGGGGHTRVNSTATVASGLGMHLNPSHSVVAFVNESTTLHDPLAVTSPIETTQDFLDWFTKIEQNMESEQEMVFKKFKIRINSFIENCEEIFECLEDSRGLIKEMEANYKFVEENSRALQLACEAMLEEQKHLIEVTEAINSRLEYFKELEVATRALSQPGGDVVLQEDFLNMLERLDVCLEFLRNNRNYRDSEVYIIRFQQCLTRAMTLIKMHFLTTLNSLYSEVNTRLIAATNGGKQAAISSLSETALNALLYTKFKAISSSSRVFIHELEKRSISDPEEYSSLLQECFYNWFNVRKMLLGPNLAEEVRRMDLGNTNTDLVKLARAGCAYLRNVCVMEWQLFREFFPSTGQNEAYQYLESLCDHLYDSLRPRILHETKLEVLCELCNVLQALISLDGDPDDDDDDDQQNDNTLTTEGIDEGDSSFEISIPPATTPTGLTPTGEERRDSPLDAEDSVKPDRSLRFSVLLNTILHDAQTRLVFRSQYIVEAEVLNYVAKPEDLEYPEKLKLIKGEKGAGSAESSRLSLIGSGNMGVVEEDGIVTFKLPPEELMQDWYPTLRRTLWVLSRLHSYVNTAIFEDFAGESVTLCRQSLTIASEKISSRPNVSKLDGQLFLVRHLLILKEMVRSIDLAKTERGMDFSNMTDALSSLLRNTSSLFNPNALFQIASKGLPSFTETIRDSKRELDGTLKLICEDLITSASLLVSSPIRAFLNRCQSYLATSAGTNPSQSSGGTSGGGASNADLTVQPWATKEEVLKLHDEFVAEGSLSSASLEVGVKEVLDKMCLYLDDEKTVNVLLPPIQSEVLEHYTTFYSLVKSEYDFATANAMTPPARIRNRLRALAGDVSLGIGSSGGTDKVREG